MRTKRVSTSSRSYPPVFGQKQGGKRRENPFVFKLIVFESTRMFLPKLTFSKALSSSGKYNCFLPKAIARWH